jgi:hypothetical protein
MEGTLVGFDYFQWIHEVLDLRRDGELRSGSKAVLPDPSHVASLAPVGTENAFLGGTDMTLNPGAEVCPNSDERLTILDLWRPRAEAMRQT